VNKKFSPSEELTIFIVFIILVIFWSIGLWFVIDFGKTVSDLCKYAIEQYLPKAPKELSNKFSSYVFAFFVAVYIIGTIVILLEGAKSRDSE